MQSLRGQLMVAVTLAAATVMLLAGAVSYVLVRRALWQQFDAGLRAQAEVLAPQVEGDGTQARIDFDNAPVPVFQHSGTGAYFTLWSAEGRVLEKSPSLGATALPWPGALPAVPAWKTVELPDGQAVRLVAMAVTPRAELRTEHGVSGPAAAPRLVLGVARSTAELQAVLQQILWLMATVGVAAVAALALTLSLVVRRGLRPMRRVTEAIVGVGEDDLSARVTVPDVPAEMMPVVHELNALLARLEEAFAREKSFTAHVAHELRTPLYGLRAKLEVALSRPRAPGAYRQTLAECLAITCTTQTMAENLLTLARLDAGQIEPRQEPLDLTALARSSWEAFADRAAERDVQVTWHGASVGVQSDPDRLRIVLNNLFDNAVSYVDAHGYIEIITAGEGGQAELCVRNTGSTLSASDIAQCCTRFWRAASAEPSRGEHCGLGLALVQRMTALLGLRLVLSANDGGWFCATITLPGRAARAAPGPAAEEVLHDHVC